LRKGKRRTGEIKKSPKKKSPSAKEMKREITGNAGGTHIDVRRKKFSQE